jgi:hypothetical protein
MRPVACKVKFHTELIVIYFLIDMLCFYLITLFKIITFDGTEQGFIITAIHLLGFVFFGSFIRFFMAGSYVVSYIMLSIVNKMKLPILISSIFCTLLIFILTYIIAPYNEAIAMFLEQILSERYGLTTVISSFISLVIISLVMRRKDKDVNNPHIIESL